MSITPPGPEDPREPGSATPPPPPPSQAFPAYESHPAAAPPAAAHGHYAGWWQRLGALLLDSLIVSIPVYALLGILIAGGAADDDVVTENEFNPIWTLISILIPYLYYALTMSRKGNRNGQTLGKQVLGIRVAREDQVPVSIWWAIGRELVKGIFAVITLGLTYLWPLWDKKNQGLHDKVMHDLVVRTEP